MTGTRPHILLNAEPFGFGPSAAIASIAPLLQARGAQLSYIGEKHTLDLQRDLNYECIYDTTNTSQAERLTLMKELASTYDLFFTAMDTDMAEIAEQSGITTAIYDALTWYWPSILPAITNADLYLAQNFFGVEQRFDAEAAAFPKHQIIAPILPQIKPATKKDLVLLNLGGLQNPFWSFEDTLTYARTVLRAVRSAIPDSDKLLITTSSSVSKALNDPVITTLGRAEMIAILSRTKRAIMTPGLGNIYDAAAFNIPTLWLPPANDSQGQQAERLAENNCSDAWIDWSNLGHAISYAADQRMVLQNITKALETICNDALSQAKLTEDIARKLASLETVKDSKTTYLVQRFGSTGANDICSAVMNYLESRVYANTN